MPDFTKGEWEITGEKKKSLHYIVCNISSWVYDDEGGSQIEIATVDGTNNAETRANARLIAAAPDMYRTLVKILDDTQNGQFADENELIALLNSIDEENREFNPMYPIP